MKKAILILLIAASSAFAAPTKKATVAPVSQPAITQTVREAYDAAKREQLIVWIEQLRVKAGEADKKAVAAEASAATSEAQRQEAEKNVSELNVKIQNLADWGVAQQDGRIKAETELLKVLPKYHFLKYWVSLGFAICAAGVVGLAIFKFAPQALNTAIGAAVGLGLPVAVGLIVFTFIQLRL